MIGLKRITAPGFQQNPRRIMAFTIGHSIEVTGGEPQWEESYGKKVPLMQITWVKWGFFTRKEGGEWNVKLNVYFTISKTVDF